MIGGLPHVEAQQGAIAGAEEDGGPGWELAERRHDPARDRAAEQRRDTIAYLPEPMPLGGVEAEPIGIGMQARGLAHGDDTGKQRMDGAWRRKCAPGAVRAGTECVTLSVQR